MKNLIIMILSISVFASCRSAKSITGSSTSDIVKIETRYETSWKTDTVYLDIPSQNALVKTSDSISLLENDYAVSCARINSDGSISHELKTKPKKIPMPVQVPVERKDSIAYHEVKTPIYIERKLTPFQKFKEYWFYISISVLLIILASTQRKPIIAFIRRFI